MPFADFPRGSREKIAKLAGMSDSSEQRSRDAEQLRRFGYAQQLLREMGGFGSFALSFSIISILTGAVTLYGHGLRFGGPVVMTVGWPLVAVMTLAVAASLAELASAYPTAGALYHWAAILGGPGWGFTTAWLNTLGQFAITAGIDYGLAGFLAPMLGLPSSRGYVLTLYALVLFSHALLNHIGVRTVAMLNWFSAWYHVGGALVVIAALALFAPKQPWHFLVTRFTDQPYPYGYAFAVGLLQAQWTFTGYDASAHITEETVDPTRNAPWGIVLSVAVSGVMGWLLLVAVTLAIGDLPAAVRADNPFIFVLSSALGSSLGGALVWVVIGAMWFCGLASITSNSRMLFAFARDGGLPASPHVARVSSRFSSPHVAIWVSAVAAFVIALWAEAYAVMVALSTTALYASYAIPIGLRVRRRAVGQPLERGPWHLGPFSTAANFVALGWIAVITVLFILPPNELAGFTFAGALLVLAVYWKAYMGSRFRGPRLA
jgi:amino acid transporter